MNAFKVLEFDRRPMKVKGSKIIASTIIPLANNLPKSGSFLSLPSGKTVELKYGGGLTQCAPDQKKLFSLMKPQGASLGESLLDVDDPISEVFVEERTTVARAVVNAWVDQPDLTGYWLPGIFIFKNKLEGEGWFKVGEGIIELLVLEMDSIPSLKSIRSKNDMDFCIEL